MLRKQWVATTTALITTSMFSGVECGGIEYFATLGSSSETRKGIER
jgi:hypothetical protein